MACRVLSPTSNTNTNINNKENDMRIHTDRPYEVVAAIHEATRRLPGVYATTKQHKSRSREAGIELRLEGNGYPVNTGRSGAHQGTIGATWDEWGVVLAAIFEADPTAFAGTAKRPVYADRADYHHLTGYRFSPVEGLPEDTHKRHKWQYIGPRQFACGKCSATIAYHI